MTFASQFSKLIWLFCATLLPFPAAAQDNDRDLIIIDIEVVGHDLKPGVSKLSTHNILKIAAPEQSPGSILKSTLEMHANLFGSNPRRESMLNIAIEPWMLRDSVRKEEFDNWIPALKTAPFRLLAVVNRPDLRASTATGSATSHGQVRFVYCLVKSAASGSIIDRPCTSFLIAIEMSILSEGNSSKDVGILFKAWANLRSLDPATPAYLDGIDAMIAALSALDVISTAININEIETDLALGKSPALDATWVMRSFILDPTTLSPRTRTIESFGDRYWISAICRQLASMEPILGGEATKIVRNALTTAPRNDTTAILSLSDSSADITASIKEICPYMDPSWSMPLAQSLAERTCNGCHGVATGTVFTHISPRDVGHESRLSRFLLGSNSRCKATNDCQSTLDYRREELFKLLRYLDEPLFTED